MSPMRRRRKEIRTRKVCMWHRRLGWDLFTTIFFTIFKTRRKEEKAMWKWEKLCPRRQVTFLRKCFIQFYMFRHVSPLPTTIVTDGVEKRRNERKSVRVSYQRPKNSTCIEGSPCCSKVSVSPLWHTNRYLFPQWERECLTSTNQ